MFWNKPGCRPGTGQKAGRRKEIETAGEIQVREGRGNRRGALDSRNGKINIRVLAFLPLAIRCMAGAAADVYLSHQRATPISQQGLTHETNAVSGDIPGKMREQRQKELDSVVEEDMLATFMNVTSLGRTTGTDCSINWMIENPFNQEELTRVETTHDDIGEKISEIGAIRPGNYLESGSLLILLPAGGYGCITVFLTYQEGTGILMGQVVAKIRLVLQE